MLRRKDLSFSLFCIEDTRNCSLIALDIQCSNTHSIMGVFIYLSEEMETEYS